METARTRTERRSRRVSKFSPFARTLEIRELKVAAEQKLGRSADGNTDVPRTFSSFRAKVSPAVVRLCKRVVFAFQLLATAREATARGAAARANVSATDYYWLKSKKRRKWTVHFGETLRARWLVEFV